MSDFLDRFSMDCLSDLRDAVRSGTAENHVELAAGVYMSWDAEDAEVDVTYQSPDWAALSVDYTVTGRPRWLSINLVFAKGQLDAGDVLGLVIEGYAREGIALPLRLRSMVDGENYDCDWGDTVELLPENGVSVALQTLETGIVGREGYHTLIIGLPLRDMALTIRNIRVFRVLGVQGLRSAPRTLSSFAV